jgi:hypothetical protein
LLCFYDGIQMRLCNDFNHQRQANCFEFNHTLKRELDARLSYHIEPHIGIGDQPIIVQVLH